MTKRRNAPRQRSSTPSTRRHCCRRRRTLGGAEGQRTNASNHTSSRQQRLKQHEQQLLWVPIPNTPLNPQTPTRRSVQQPAVAAPCLMKSATASTSAQKSSSARGFIACAVRYEQTTRTAMGVKSLRMQKRKEKENILAATTSENTHIHTHTHTHPPTHTHTHTHTKARVYTHPARLQKRRKWAALCR